MRKVICAYFFLASLLLLPHASAADEITDEDFDVIEIQGFEVFSNSITVIDGITGKEYEGKHPVVLGFRREFDNLLLKFHKRLLIEEHKKLKTHSDSFKTLPAELDQLAASFGFKGKLKIEGPRLTREFSIFNRMIKDPFFKIDELVVWDINQLKLRNNLLPKNKYAKNLRPNPETGEWERRILTKWEVSCVRRNRNNNGTHHFYTHKQQGFNLDTNKGFHLIDQGLPWDVPPHAFREVELQYPILVDTAINVDEQVRELSRDFIENLFYIYDPFSWVARGNTRFPWGYNREIHDLIRSQKINVNQRNWFDRVLATFLNDVATLKYWSADLIYAQQMASSSPKNRNILGEDLDLLNWHKKEKRQVNYDIDTPNTIPNISFDNSGRARYILLDAYRRYGDKFVDALRTRVLAVSEKTDAKQLVRDALAEASGVSAKKYIPAAIRAQKAELGQFLAK
ncbi:hypothetical protein [Pelagicoccus mobilis]|uniref:Uncharacterized protein n=1 Tax=Pelagicoccus mobilis TaxID=415221 RepID=A0A934S113_9BACT|nr:hypothetical protein [Pelagicoccus mobilis]MBK1877479.1 hypothetical protein [Pelagicoccus mobilis]